MPEKAEQTVAVMLPLPVGSQASGCYDYLAPPGLALRAGDIVEAPLGKRWVHGVVWGPAQGGVAPDKLKSLGFDIPAVLILCTLALARRYDLPPLPEEERRFIDWVAAYSLAPPGAVLRMALSVPKALEPPPSRLGYRAAEPPADDGLRMTPARRKVLAVAEGWHRGPTVDPVEDPTRLGPIVADLVGKARKNAGMDGQDLD